MRILRLRLRPVGRRMSRWTVFGRGSNVFLFILFSLVLGDVCFRLLACLLPSVRSFVHLYTSF